MAERAVAEMNSREIDGQALHVSRASNPSDRTALLREQHTHNVSEQQLKSPGRKLYVKKLAAELDETGLEKHFSPFGAIDSCNIDRDHSGASRGFGFVCFTTGPDANKPMTQLNRSILGDTETPIFVEMAGRKGVTDVT